MDKMILNATAEWDETLGFWEVYIADEERAGKFNVIACNEWVIPLAEMAFNGLDTTPILNLSDGWSVVDATSDI